jgi:hypothetical protein
MSIVGRYLALRLWPSPIACTWRGNALVSSRNFSSLLTHDGIFCNAVEARDVCAKGTFGMER